MRPSVPQIVAFGGGGFSMETDNTLMDDHVLRLTGTTRPRVCFIPTASGDADHYVVRFYRQFAHRAEASHVSLFRRDTGGGGSRETWRPTSCSRTSSTSGAAAWSACSARGGRTAST